ncbi:hypothetical protein [Saccharopolyspora shandongensis]|uniref:hypothetical protein n=1 Tax=Saccharopolyspora shandongensis TaxID=418495 RepID=UPI0033F00C06
MFNPRQVPMPLTEAPDGEIAATALGHQLYRDAQLAQLSAGRATWWDTPAFSAACRAVRDLTPDADSSSG